MFDQGYVREVLTKLNYHPIQQCGQYFRTKALYRGGDNPSSLSIHSRTGWCKDFPENRSFPLVGLVERTLKTKDPKIISSFIDAPKNPTYIPPEKPKMPKTYPEECLRRLMPNYAVYEGKRISAKTMKMYKAGLATTGPMYQRIVFPIYDEFGQIYGFSGRKIHEDNDLAKWKHLGQKNTWVYPYYSVVETREPIEKSRDIYLVESIGDSLALSECGLFNHLVNFGIDCSAALQCFLISLDPKRIIISTNNDSEKEVDRGKIGAIKTFMKLMNHFPVERLKIKMPTKNDLSEMHQQKINLNDWAAQENFLTAKEVLDFANGNGQFFAVDKLAKLNRKLA